MDRLLAVPLPSNRSAADAGNQQIQASIDEGDVLDGRIKELTAEDVRRQADAAAQRCLGTRSDSTAQSFGRGADTVYARGNGNSYFRDLIASATPGHLSQFEAIQRLSDHAQMVERAAEDLPPELRATSERGAAGHMERRVNPNRIDGQGGNFVPPLWIIDEYAAARRPLPRGPSLRSRWPLGSRPSLLPGMLSWASPAL